jgi:hypothetical protein
MEVDQAVRAIDSGLLGLHESGVVNAARRCAVAAEIPGAIVADLVFSRWLQKTCQA